MPFMSLPPTGLHKDQVIRVAKNGKTCKLWKAYVSMPREVKEMVEAAC